MKFSNLLTAICFILFGVIANGQEKIKEKDIIGNWKLVIEIDEALDEAKEELDEDDEFLGKLILSSVSGFVGSLLDEIEIYLEFKPEGELTITVDAFGETEVETGSWYIDRKGRLVIEDTERIQTNDDYWVMKDGILINEDEEDEKYVYMVNID